MPGTKEGGKAAAATNIAKYGNSFYANIGRMGGRKGKTGGFHAAIPCKDVQCVLYGEPHYIRQCAGYKGGKISRRQGVPNARSK